MELSLHREQGHMKLVVIEPAQCCIIYTDSFGPDDILRHAHFVIGADQAYKMIEFLHEFIRKVNC